MTPRLGSRKRRIRVTHLRHRDGDRCTWCCRTMRFEPILPHLDCRLHATLEHLIPVILGGSDDVGNLALACLQCNNARGGAAVEFFPSWALESVHEEARLEEAHGGEG